MLYYKRFFLLDFLDCMNTTKFIYIIACIVLLCGGIKILDKIFAIITLAFNISIFGFFRSKLVKKLSYTEQLFTAMLIQVLTLLNGVLALFLSVLKM